MVEIDYYQGGKLYKFFSNKFMKSSEFNQVPPCPDFYHVDFLFMKMDIHSINQMEIQRVYTRGLSVCGFSSV